MWKNSEIPKEAKLLQTSFMNGRQEGSVFALRAAFLWHSTGIRIRPLFQAFIVLGKRGKGGKEDRERDERTMI